MKLPATMAACLITIGILSPAFGDPGAVSGGGSGGAYNTQPIGTSPTSSSTTSGPSPSPAQNDPDIDDTLYRTSTKDSPGSSVMLRDEGALREKPRAREKVVEVNSSKSLPSSGTDPKFQGSLLNLGLAPMERVAAKTTETKKEGATVKSTQANPIRQARDRDTRKELEPLSASSKLDLSLLPAPSATVSPAAKSAPSQKQ
jgi:hypothetical protein